MSDGSVDSPASLSRSPPAERDAPFGHVEEQKRAHMDTGEPVIAFGLTVTVCHYPSGSSKWNYTLAPCSSAKTASQRGEVASLDLGTNCLKGPN